MFNHKDTVEIEPAISLNQRRTFLKLPLAERQRILALQADQIVEHYEGEQSERQYWQSGNIIEY